MDEQSEITASVDSLYDALWDGGEMVSLEGKAILERHLLAARRAGLEQAAVRCDEIAEIASRAKNIGMQAGSMASASEIRKLAVPRGHNGGPALPEPPATKGEGE